MRSSIRVPGGLAAALALPLVFVACGGEPPADPVPPDPTPPDLDLVTVSGDGQEGKAGEALPEPFVVRVTDADGDPVEDVDVTWNVHSGDGDFVQGHSGDPVGSDVTETDPEGETHMFFQPGELGTSAVVAEVVSLRDARATFTVDATELVIHLRPIFHSVCTHEVDPPKFAPKDVTVPVGTPVEWVYWSEYNDACEARVTSAVEPPGGGRIDGGVLNPGDRFGFVPEVVGTWEYRDEVMGQTGTLTAQ